MVLKTMIAAVAALALLAGPAAAAPAAGPTAAAGANPQAEALVRRYLTAIHFERTMDAVQAAMLPVIAAQAGGGKANLTAEDKAMLVDIVRKEMRDKMMPRMIEKMVPLYASTFTVAELQAMVAFYESPVGRSITEKTPSLAPRSAEIVRELMPQVMVDVVQEIIARKCPDGKCEGASPPKAAAS